MEMASLTTGIWKRDAPAHLSKQFNELSGALLTSLN